MRRLMFLSMLLLMMGSLEAETLYRDSSGRYYAVEDDKVSASLKTETAKEDDAIVSSLKALTKELLSLKREIKALQGQKLSKAEEAAALEEEADSKEEAKDELKFEATIRAGYINYKEEATASLISKAIGGNIGFTTKEIVKGIKAKLNFYAVEALNTQNSNDALMLEFNNTIPSYGYIGEAALHGSFGDHKIIVGRQKLDMAHNDSDDIRMLPNLFEAVRYSYKELFDLTHITSMAGWENGGQKTRFINVHEVMGITDSNGSGINKGISVAHIALSNESESLSFDLYDYLIHDAINTLYVEASFEKELAKDYTLTLSAQYDVNKGSGTFIMGGTSYSTYNASVYGLSAELALADVTLSLAMNKASGDQAPIGSLGGGPYFTSIEDSTIDGVGTNDASAYTLGLEYEAKSILEGLTLGYTYGAFAAADKSVADHKEQDFALSYEKKDALKLTVAYVLVDHASITGNADFSQFRAFLDIPFEK